SDILFAIGLNNVKRVVSALLVLSASLGWGVVRPSLELDTKLKLVTLGLFYLAFSVFYDMKRISASSKGNVEETLMVWALPVALCDVIYVFWIYQSMMDVQSELTQQGQEAKLKMYKRLQSTLTKWMAIWILYTFLSILVSSGETL